MPSKLNTSFGTIGHVSFWPKHQPLRRVGEILGNPSNIRYARVADMWNHWPKDTLRLTVNRDYGFPRPVIAHRIQRRVKAALYEAMRQRGYDHEGRSLRKEKPGLTGTLFINPARPKMVGLEDPMPSMVQDCSTLVTRIEDFLRKQGPNPLASRGSHTVAVHKSSW